MLWRTLSTRLLASLETALRLQGTLYGALLGKGGSQHLLPLPDDSPLPQTSARPQLPLKKFLLPPAQQLWSRQGGAYALPPVSAPIVLWGVTPADLAALGYLDRVWQDDEAYLQRRRRLFVVGIHARQDRDRAPGSTQLEDLPFDLFLTPDRLWCGTEQARALCSPLPEAVGDDPFPLSPLLNLASPSLPEDLEQRFLATATATFWHDEARRCLACGLCSAVCPTCSCFDLRDALSLDGLATRSRFWDNCFFCDHGLVAGGHNFRPTPAERLRFRFEHKFLGFGALRGTASCVDCARCSEACPVGIDLQHLLREVTGATAP